MTRPAASSQLQELAQAGARTPFVPRPALEHALRDALCTTQGALLVGEAGMGKSRLAQHAVGDGPHLELSCSHLRRVTARDVAAALMQQVHPPPADLVHLLQGGSAGAGAGADEGLLLRAVAHRMAALVPAVSVLVHDAELIPDSELVALAAVLQVSERPWLVTSRRVLEGLPLPVIDVPPLTRAEAGELVDALLPGAPAALHEQVLERSGGWPLLLEQCAGLLLDNGALRVVDGAVQLLAQERLGEIPRSMRAFVTERLDLLSTEEAEVLGTAAVLGNRAELDLLQFLVGERGGLVSTLLERGLLRHAPDALGQPCVRFSHSLVHDAAYERVPAADRIAIHKAAAEWYAILPVSQVLESQAFHLEAAARLEDPDCDLLRRTVEAMVLYARSIEEERTQVGRETLLRAQQLVDARPECGADTLTLLLALASVSFTAGREEEAARAAQQALVLAQARDDLRAVAEAHLHLGRVVIDADPPTALEELDLAAAAYAEAGDPGGEARVEITRGFVRQHDAGQAQQLEGLERSYSLALRSGDARLQAHCAQQLAMHHAFATGVQAFELWAERARDMSRRDDLALEPRLQTSSACLAMYGLDPPQGRHVAGEALASGRDLGLRDVFANALIAALDLALLAGDLAGVRALLPEARDFAATRPSDWWALQYDLVEARLRSRSGDQAGAQDLLAAVATHQLAAMRVLQHDLAEARAWVSLERGRFGEARALAAEAVAIDLDTEERCAQLRPRLVELVATVAAGDNVSLGTIADLRSLARDTGLGTVAQMATRWLYVDELTRGWSVDLHGVQPCDVVECRALDLEIEALASRRWERLLAAAEVWAELGTTVWQARALLWHGELTDTGHPEAEALLVTLGAPAGLAETLDRKSVV